MNDNSPAFAFSILTLGCKVNQADSAELRRKIEHAGGRETSLNDSPALVVINTCTVTGEADRKARQLIRRARRKSPKALIIVTGCGVSNLGGLAHSDSIAKMGDGILVLGAEGGTGLETILKRHFTVSSPVSPKGASPQGGFRRTRGLLKVQDGCNRACAYCIVPLVRGTSRSIPVGEAVERAVRMAAAGCREIVVTGVNLGAYGQDLEGAPGLCTLLRELLGATREVRYRLSSLEPDGLSVSLIDLMAGQERICRHLHLPLQHAADSVLHRMRRPYDAAEFSRWILLIRQAMPDIALTTDVMAGFPGESSGEFQQLVQYLHDHPFARLHVFGFSPRPGTAAGTMAQPVAAPERAARCRMLLNMGRVMSLEFNRRFLKTTRPVLVESPLAEETERGRSPRRWEGITDNYIKVRVEGPDLERGLLVRAHLQEMEGTMVSAVVIRP